MFLTVTPTTVVAFIGLALFALLVIVMGIHAIMNPRTESRTEEEQ